MDWSPENTPELGGSGEGGGSGKGGGSKGSEEEARACTGALQTLHY